MTDINPLDWQTIQPHIDELLNTELTPETVEPWLQRWSDLAATLKEATAQINRAVSENTADKEAEKQFLTLVEDILPQMRVADQALKNKLLALESYTPSANTTQLFKRFQTQAKIFRPENVPLQSELMKLANEYDKLVGGMTIQWAGQEETLPQARLHLLDPDRSTRESVWRLITGQFGQVREQLNNLYLEMLARRRQIAHNAGFDNYRSYRWLELNRFDYTPEDCFTFHDAIEQEVVPLAQTLYLQRANQLGVETLRPWDTEVDPNGDPLHPFDNITELEEGGLRILQQVDPDLAQHFTALRDGFLDLGTRPNKAPGGYCGSFPISGKAYIFMNAAGTHADVLTLLHEAGHAFHFMEAQKHPLLWNQHAPMEFCEVASMAMELLSAPYLEKSRGGFYEPADARRAYAEQLRDIVLFLPYMAVVDAFQHWVYTVAPPDVTAAKLDEKWGKLWDRFMVGIDYRGLESAKATGWHRKGHIFTDPFYYVEYGLAQLGALQVWRNALRDPVQAVADYRAALALGGTRPLRELFQTAGATFAFDRQTVGELMQLIGEELEKLSSAGVLV